MRIIYGTKNQAKLDAMKKTLEPLHLEIVGLNELDVEFEAVEENGKDPLENAKIKALSFYRALKEPVFSCDSGLYFKGVADELQPKTHVRRVNGKELSDEEMTEYYAQLAKEHGGSLEARYQNGICFVWDEEHIFTSQDESLFLEPFLLVDKAHGKRVKGFPLDCLSKDLKSGQYYYDLDEKQLDQTADKGFQTFFRSCLNEIGVK